MNQNNTIDANTTVSELPTGRPRVPLLVGQMLYIERGYTILGLSQARIAQQVGIAIPRVRRYLVDKGLYLPRNMRRTPARLQQLAQALEQYVNGDLVIDICQTYKVNPAELYKLLRAKNIPFRTTHHLQNGGQHLHQTNVQGRSEDG